ncbi:F0F1 ATP synthase subunit A [Cerasicoccus fimbriatus]|uniref:F0F1 ATP synthase subunit A n=1 Tax=Cerasicoccus fimbriatus TaxID=3014554 RepID=UPI0022B4148A|nr:F0F1 ATP synthase subunit A [Cerasicoccus sp. TK19100]
MAHFRKFLLPTGFLLSAAPLMAAGGGGVSPYAYELFSVFGLPVTNAMITGWVISILLIVGIKLLVGTPKLVPSGGQAVVEGMLTGVLDIMEPIIGKKLIKKVFPLLITLFVFILINNWSGLLPGVGSFGHFVVDAEFPTIEAAEAAQHAGQVIRSKEGQYVLGHFYYYFRPANADLNTTLALAIISFIAWIWYVLRYAGVKVLAYDLFGNKADKKEVPGPIYLALFIVFAGVGLIEVVSILSRLVSLPFRLFGNVFGGENLLTSMHGMIAWVVPVPFFFLEILIGLVQALVFTLLTAVYIGLIVNHGDDDH